MKKIMMIVAALVFLSASRAEAIYVIDGSVNDWGITLNTASKTKGYLDTHLPSGGNDIDSVTEDNVDHLSGNNVYVGPGYSTGNRYDAEAMYFDNDLQNAYIAVITGLPQNESTFPAGDIFIDTGKYQNTASATYDAKKYNYGIDIGNKKLYQVNSWVPVQYGQHNAANPWEIGDRTYLGDVEFVYGSELNTHYVMEARLPLALVNLVPNGTSKDVWVHWTMECGNDFLNLKGDVNPVIPEPATLLLFGSGALLSFWRRRTA